MDEENRPPTKTGNRKAKSKAWFGDAFKVNPGPKLCLRPAKHTIFEEGAERRRVKVQRKDVYFKKNLNEGEIQEPLILEKVQKLDITSFQTKLASLLELRPVPLSNIIRVVIEGVLVSHWSFYSLGQDGQTSDPASPITILKLGLEAILRYALSTFVCEKQKLAWESIVELMPLIISFVTRFNSKRLSHTDMEIFHLLNGIFQLGETSTLDKEIFEAIIDTCSCSTHLIILNPHAQKIEDTGYWRTHAKTEKHMVALEKFYTKDNLHNLVELASFEEARYDAYLRTRLAYDLQASDTDQSPEIHPEDMRFMLKNVTVSHLPPDTAFVLIDILNRAKWRPLPCALDGVNGPLVVDPYASSIQALMHREVKRMAMYNTSSQELSVVSPCTKQRSSSKPTLLQLGVYSVHVVEKIGQGSFGRVFKVADTITKVHKVLKFQKSNMAIREFYILTRVNQRQRQYKLESLRYQTAEALYFHPKHSIIIGSFYPETTLLNYTNALLRSTLGMTETKVVTIVKQLLLAILSLHDMGILHNDIKLDNVLVDQTNKTNPIVRLIDFGRAIDLRLLPPNAELVPAKLSREQPSEDVQRLSPHQQDLGRPWLYHEDYFGLAGIIYSLLAYRALDDLRMVPSLDPSLPPRFHPVPPIPHNHLSRAKFWDQLLDTLINPDLVALERKQVCPDPNNASPNR
ncbi:protein kinase, partial [Massospora cicadina]